MTAAVIEISELSRRFGTTAPVTVLDHISLTVQHGEYLSIVGPSGSGKSTLLNVLGLLDTADDGEYSLDGTPVTQMSEEQRARLRARTIGFVFQAFHLMPHRTVLDNVLVAMLYAGVPRAQRRERALSALNRVHLSHRIDALPTTLSGGERQRVAIARAVVAQPHLLLADEPTGNLDSVNAQGVLDLFDELHAAGLTLIVITHDDAVSLRAQRRIRISDGRLSEEP